MGLDCAAVKFLWAATFRWDGNIFPERDTLERVAEALDFHCDPTGRSTFWRTVFQVAVSSLDASTFEGATHVFDMNLPLPTAIS
jgi:hypothetical protein